MADTPEAGGGTVGVPGEDMTVAEILVDYLARAGVRHVFGVAGSTIMPVLDALADDDRLDWIGARYELSAAEMASGYARVSGRLGVVMTHVGPGATSCVTAMVSAARDGVPLLLVTGNEESATLARHPYHDWDVMPVMDAITALSYRITRADEVPHVVRRALGVATRSITRPVHIDLPEDIALQTVPAAEVATWLVQVSPLLDDLARAPALPLSRPAPTTADVDRVAELVMHAHAPVIVLGEALQPGDGVAAIVERCERLGVPYVTSFGGRGGVGGGPSYAGTIGRFGSRQTTALVSQADLLIALGAELSDIDTAGWRVPGTTPVVAVHADPDKIDLRVPVTHGVVADPGALLDALVEALDGAPVAPDAWRRRAGAVDRADGPLGDVTGSAELDAQMVTRMIAAAPPTWAVAMDPGLGALSLSAPAEFGRTRFLYAYGLGAMGFAVPNAIGAVCSGAVDGALVVIGDGSFFMSLPSLESIASLDVPVVVVVLDDGGFGSQRQKQREAYAGRTVGVDYDNPDIAAIGAALGIPSGWISSSDDVEKACASLAGRTHGALYAVRRTTTSQITWYEGSARRR